MGQFKKSDYKANMKAIFRRKLSNCQNKTILKLINISNRFLMRQRILLSDRFLCEATGILSHSVHEALRDRGILNVEILDGDVVST